MYTLTSTNTHMHTHKHTHTHANKHTRTQSQILIHQQTHQSTTKQFNIYKHTQTHTHTHTHTHTRTHTQLHTHTNIHTHEHTHTHQSASERIFINSPYQTLHVRSLSTCWREYPPTIHTKKFNPRTNVWVYKTLDVHLPSTWLCKIHKYVQFHSCIYIRICICTQVYTFYL